MAGTPVRRSRLGTGCVLESEVPRVSAVCRRSKQAKLQQDNDTSHQSIAAALQSENVPVRSALLEETAKMHQKRKEEQEPAAAIAPDEEKGSGLRHAAKLASIVSGIYVFFLMFGYYQEQIFHLKDPLTGGRFSYSFWLVFIVCVSNTLFSFSMLLLQNKGDSRRAFRCVDVYVMKELFFISLTYAGAMLCTNYAMNHITYPTQVLVKSAKMVPIVVGGLLIFRRTYPWYDYMSVVVVTISLVLFNSAKAGKSSSSSSGTATGLVLLCVSLLCDGLTGPRQDRLLSRYKHIGPVLMMFLTNVFSIIWTALVTILIEGKAPYLLLQHEGHALSSVTAFAVSGSLGQLFIYQSLKCFGSLYTSLFTTLRKATSTVLSVYVFGHSLTLVQWTSMASIFVTLMLQSYCSKKTKSKLKNPTGPKRVA